MINLFQKAREPINSLTHTIGAALSALGLLSLVIYGLNVDKTSVLSFIGASVFGISLLALYSASAIYHFVNTTAARLVRFRKLDHAMIYVLIAGTYTPLSLNFMEWPHGFIFTMIIWAIASVGIIVKLIWLNAPRWLSTSFYLLMGWSIIFDFKAFNVPTTCLSLIAAGGISYSVGAIFYILKKPNLSPSWGFHELFHLFILSGSLLHFIAIFIFVL